MEWLASRKLGQPSHFCKRRRLRGLIDSTRLPLPCITYLPMGNSHKPEKMGFSRISLKRCGISDFCFHRFIGLDGAYIIAAKKLGAVAKNFPLGGTKRSDRRYFLTSLLCSKKSVACRSLCHFVGHISSPKISKICKQRFFLTRKKMSF